MQSLISSCIFCASIVKEWCVEPKIKFWFENWKIKGILEQFTFKQLNYLIIAVDQLNYNQTQVCIMYMCLCVSLNVFIFEKILLDLIPAFHSSFPCHIRVIIMKVNGKHESILGILFTIHISEYICIQYKYRFSLLSYLFGYIFATHFMSTTTSYSIIRWLL